MQHRVIQELSFHMDQAFYYLTPSLRQLQLIHLINANDKIRNWDCLLTEQSLLKFEPLYLINICSM